MSLTDANTRNPIALRVTYLTIEETNIAFTTQLLRENRHYNITVIASNVRGPDTSHAMISKAKDSSLLDAALSIIEVTPMVDDVCMTTDIGADSLVLQNKQLACKST